ncbi:MAG: flagellar basal body-associated FliL family protein [Bacteriovoracaceae bacterium]|nr:flagellar basal body-associated FliL family protein [Bacteriovoracaceae bacterium]
MTGNPMFDKILLGANGAVAILAAGLVFYAHNGIKRPPTDQKSEEASLIQTAELENQIKPFEIKKMIVNLYSEGSRLRYLDIDMGILPFKEGDLAVIKEREYLFKTKLIEIAGGMTPDDLTSITGKILLETRLKKATNEALGAPVVKKIYFAKFVVQ